MSAARAGVAAYTGSIEFVSKPAGSVETGILESDTKIRLFAEKKGVLLASGLNVDAIAPGTYNDATPAAPGTIPAKTIVNSYFLHLDRVGASGDLLTLSGSVTFDERIIGVIFSDANLDASDSLLGNSAYSTGTTYRGLLSGIGSDVGDVLIWTCGMTITVELPIYSITDQVRIITTRADEQLDYGDAPDSYHTSLDNDGARHRVINQLYLGDFADMEPDGSPSDAADCDDNTSVYPGLDDETGLVSLSGLTPGGTATFGVAVTVIGKVPAYVDAWVDLNLDGEFQHPDEQVIASAMVSSSGIYSFSYVVPSSAVPGFTYARFRISSAGGLSPTGLAEDGEVEDYLVPITSPISPGVDLGLDLPAVTSTVVLTENIARAMTLNVTNRGTSMATNIQVAINVPAGLRVQSATNTAGACQVTQTNVTCSTASLLGHQTFSVDLVLRPNFLAPSSDLQVNLSDLTGVVRSAQTDVHPQDNSLAVPVTVRAQTDWGDARGSFPVTIEEDGAHHRYATNAPWLGTRWDNDYTGTHSLLADWDDTHGGMADEDGIEFTTALLPGRSASVIVTLTAAGFLDAWADFNNDGDWADAGEQIFTTQRLNPGTNTLTFALPRDAVAGPITTRWRSSTTGGLSYTGNGGPGEVEDHLLEVQPAPVTDLHVSLDHPILEGIEGDNIRYMLTVSNRSAILATGVRLVDRIDPNFTLESATSSQGECALTNETVSCALGDLGPGQTATVTIVLGTDPIVNRSFAGALDIESFSAQALANEADADEADNTVQGRALISRRSYTAYVQGKLFYNDMRMNGNFAWRLDENGNRGLGRNYSDNASSSSVNWLGALDVTAYLYHLDGFFPVLLDTTHVLSDGSYLFSYSASGSDSLAIVILFELSYEDDQRAFVIDDGASDVYTYWHPSATPMAPYSTSTTGTTIVPDAYYGGTQAAYDNEDHQAAMVFASMVDATRVWHVGERWVGKPVGDVNEGSPMVVAEPVPFRLESHGRVTVHFPEGKVGKGFGKSPTELNVGAPGIDTDSDDVKEEWTKWHNGNLTAHEYGHVLHQRTWECGYGWGCENDDEWAVDWGPDDYFEKPLIPFKEAWGNLVAYATFEEDGTDHTFDDHSCSYQDVSPSAARPYGDFDDGHHYPGNVCWFLADWHDAVFDDDPTLPGGGDHFTAELYSMWQNLQGMWDVATDDERATGLGVMDYIGYYLIHRKSVAALGADEHLRYLDLITDLAAQNGIGKLTELAVSDAGACSIVGFFSELPRFYQVQAPSHSDGQVTVKVASSVDAVVALYDSSGNELARANAAGAGGTEELAYTGVVRDQTYSVRVGPAQYGVSGSYSLDIAFGFVLPVTKTTAEGELVWWNAGVAAASSPDAQFSTPVPPISLETHTHAWIGDRFLGSRDTDSYYFGVPEGWGGSYIFRAERVSGDVHPVMAVYDAATGTQLGFDEASGAGATASLTLDLSESKRYIVAVADATGSGTGDVQLEVQPPVTASVFGPALDDDGTVTVSNFRLRTVVESEFVKLVAPRAANGTLTITITPDDRDLDVDMVLFDADGSVVASAVNEAAGDAETFTINGIVPDASYFLTVFPRDYESTGDFDMNIEFGMFTGSIQGSVFEDADADGAKDASESNVTGWKTYIDENMNGAHDTGEPIALVDGSGNYQFTDVALYHFYYVRLEMMEGWKLTAPAYGRHYITPTLDNPDALNKDFGVYRLNKIAAFVYEDFNRNGASDAGDSVFSGVKVFVDLDHDGIAGANEPAATTDAAGNVLITEIPSGTYELRVEERFSFENVQPATGGYSVTFATAELKSGYSFGLHRPRDLGDAPDTRYRTLLGSSGAWHTIIPGFYLGHGVDAELDGQPSPGADADELNNEPDEDGIRFITWPLMPGSPATIEVLASAAGVLDAWIDFNGVNAFEAGAERIFGPGGAAVAAGTTTLTFAVPAAANIGQTYARFRFSGGGVAGPTGYGNDGEVEDYPVSVGVAASAPSLSIVQTGTSLEISWSNPDALLEEALHVNGPYTTVPGATSPYVVPIGAGPMKFYRLRLGRLPFEIPATGQTTFYDNDTVIAAPLPGQPFHGQDAQYKRPPMSYTDNGDGTITDNTTGLMWQKDVIGPVSWDDAVAGAATFAGGGYNDWRMASIKELYSLFDASGVFGTSAAASTPFIDDTVFDFFYVAGARFFDVQEWSATEYVGTTMKGAATVFGVNFADGRIKGYPKVDPATGSPALHYVRYVRGSPDYGKNQFEDNGDGTVTDHATGLVWQKADSSKTLNWQEALEYAENLTLAGYDDWRAPTLKELQSIVDYTRTPPVSGTAAIDTNHFEISENESYFWTSTTIVDGPSGANYDKGGYLSFGQAFGYMETPPGSGHYELFDVHGAGTQRVDFKSDPASHPTTIGPQNDLVRIYNYVRCVRGGLR